MIFFIDTMTSWSHKYIYGQILTISGKFLKRSYFSKLFPQMVLFWNLFLHGSVFYVNCMEIASPIGEFGLASTCGTGLASLTGDLTMHGTRQFDWRVALGGAFFQARVAGMCSRRRVGCSEHQLVALASCALI